MEQVSQFVSGERDYTVIKGGTGPLVYPAAHVYTYTGLYYLTSEGKDILLAQKLFSIRYIVTLALVMACYWRAKVRFPFEPPTVDKLTPCCQAPPYIFPLLILSKRLHSIFVLRCFNDCVAVFFLWLTIFLFQRKHWVLGSLAYSWGLGVKMSLLLTLPAVGIVLLLGRGFSGALRSASLMAQLQVVIGTPFLSRNAWGYLSRAFELSRQFLFKWTVNWRCVGEALFLSRKFAIALLVLHASTLVLFATTRWLKPTGKSPLQLLTPMLALKSPFTEQEEREVLRSATPQYILTTILSANLIGLLFARSLHYQFYAYLAWSTPYLLWRSGLHPVLQFALWVCQEWAWNVYPSTTASSATVVGVLAATVILVLVGAKSEFEPHRAPKDIATQR